MSLREKIRDHFDVSEIKTLCFDLDIDFEELPPGSKSDTVRGLIEYVERHDRLVALVTYLRTARPDIDWPDTARPLTQEALWGKPERTPFPFEPDFVFVSPGPFLLGSPPENGDPPQESPQHEVDLSGFYISRLPITNAQYAAFVKQTRANPPEKSGWFGSTAPKGKEGHPVVGVSWHDAAAYCAWLAALTGSAMRLPTEAEWEKAARGSDGRRYPWGDTWQDGRCNPDVDQLTPADAFPEGASPYGCLDMVGNAAEWTSTLWGRDWLTCEFPYPYSAVDGREANPVDPPAFRIFRGTTLGKEPNESRLRCAVRSWYAPDNRDRRRGFRVVMEP